VEIAAEVEVDAVILAENANVVTALMIIRNGEANAAVIGAKIVLKVEMTEERTAVPKADARKVDALRVAVNAIPQTKPLKRQSVVEKVNISPQMRAFFIESKYRLFQYLL
jgi:hypothetical protein